MDFARAAPSGTTKEIETKARVNCTPFLGQAKLEFSPDSAHEAVLAREPFISVIGGLFPIALCGLTSL